MPHRPRRPVPPTLAAIGAWRLLALYAPSFPFAGEAFSACNKYILEYIDSAAGGAPVDRAGAAGRAHQQPCSGQSASSMPRTAVAASLACSPVLLPTRSRCPLGM